MTGECRSLNEVSIALIWTQSWIEGMIFDSLEAMLPPFVQEDTGRARILNVVGKWIKLGALDRAMQSSPEERRCCQQHIEYIIVSGKILCTVVLRKFAHHQLISWWLPIFQHSSNGKPVASNNSKMFLNDMESSGPTNVPHFAQLYFDKAHSAMKQCSAVIYSTTPVYFCSIVFSDVIWATEPTIQSNFSHQVLWTL